MVKRPPDDHHILFTPIKINLALHVTGQRGDGYHLLDSLVDFSFEGDCLQYKPTDVKDDQFILDGPYATGLSTDNDNLVIQARELTRIAFPQNAKPVWCQLTKDLPLASGVGGGSGDAAAMLMMLKQHWKLDCSFEQLAKIGLKLGADVPMCLSALMHGKALRVQGIGEKMTPFDKACRISMVIVNHGEEIATPRVFELLENKNNSAIPFNRICYNDLDELLILLAQTRNDLFEPALKIAPQLEKVLATLDKTGALFSRMSGSGATCFGIFPDRPTAMKAAEYIKIDEPDWFVQAIETVGTQRAEMISDIEQKIATEKYHEQH